MRRAALAAAPPEIAVRAAVARSEAPDPRVDALLAHPMAQGVGAPTDLVRAALATLPEARVLACRPWEGTELCGAWRLYDPCPTRPVLASLVAHVATFPRGKSAARDDRAVALLRAHRAAIEDLLREGAAGKAPRRDLFAAALGDAAPAPTKRKPPRRA